MKGLLIKDMRLLMGQKQFLASMLLMSVVLLLTGQNYLFIISFVSVLCSRFAVTTAAFDEQNNGYAFLFALPVSRKTYALEKYLFGLALGGICWLTVTATGAVYLLVCKSGAGVTELMMTSTASLAVSGGMLSWMIPAQLKFGAEKSQIVSLVFVAVFISVIVLVAKVIVPYSGTGMSRIPGTAGWAAAGICAYVVMLLVSVHISIHIVEKKEF